MRPTEGQLFQLRAIDSGIAQPQEILGPKKFATRYWIG